MTKENKVVKFVCPECGNDKLGQLCNVLTTYPVIEIPKCGDLVYSVKDVDRGDSVVLSHQCMNCGYELTDEYGNPIIDISAVPGWCLDYCSQE